MRKKYNPFLDSMIGNYRELAKKAGADISTWSQQEVLDVINYWYSCVNDAGEDCGEENAVADFVSGTKR